MSGCWPLFSADRADAGGPGRLFSAEWLTAHCKLSHHLQAARQPQVPYFLDASKSGTGVEAKAGRFRETKYCAIRYAGGVEIGDNNLISQPQSYRVLDKIEHQGALKEDEDHSRAVFSLWSEVQVSSCSTS